MDYEVIALFVAFAVKHYIADFPLQTARMVREKGYYGKPGGLLHAACHGLLSLPILLVVLPSVVLALALSLAEAALHYHLDYAKESLSRHLGDTPANHRFWIILGLDQLLHHLTYAAMIAVVVFLRLINGDASFLATVPSHSFGVTL